jgi:hypothetical protein
VEPSPVRARNPNPGVILALGLALMLPSVFSGFLLDDYLYQEVLHGRVPFKAPSEDLFDFFPGNAEETAHMASRGYVPWWIEDDIKIAFFRPFSAALMRLEHSLLPDLPAVHHLHSLAWWGLLLAATALLYRRLFPGAIGGLALLLFALDESHVLPVAWISNRNALVAITPALLGLVAHVRWREDGWRPGLPLSVAGLCLGLLGGEMALGVAAYFLAYEMAGRPTRAGRHLHGLVPSAVVVSAYAVIRITLQYGTSGSGIYVDPSTDPLGYARLALVRMPALVGSAITGFWADLWVVAPGIRPVQITLGICAALTLGWLLRICWPALGETERRHMRWLLVGSSCALLPIAATFPSDRLLLASAIGFCPAIALVLHAAWAGWKARSRRWLAAAGLVLALMHLVLAPLSGVVYQVGLALGAHETRRLATGAPIPESAEQHAVLLWAPDHIVGLYVPLVRQHLGRTMPASWRILSLAPFDHRFTRTADDTLQLEIVDGSMMGGLFEKLYRTAPLKTGDVLDRGLIRVEIVESDAQGPVRVDFRFDRTLDHESLVFLAWLDGELRRVSPPLEGDAVRIPRTLGPAGF